MTIQETVTTVPNWLSPKNESEIIHHAERKVRQRFVGKFATEISPLGNCNDCVIEWVEWESSFGLNGDWSFVIQYTDGALVGTFITTSFEALDFGSK